MSQHRRLYLRHEQLPVEASLSRALKDLGICHDGKKALKASLSHQDPAHRLPALTDILGLWCKWLPIEGITSNVIDNPFPFPLTTMGERHESRNVWKEELKKHEKTLSGPCAQVLQFYNDWENCDPRGFRRFRSQNAVFNAKRRSVFRKGFDAATRYLQNTEGLGVLGMYDFCVPCHIDINASSLQKAKENIRIGHDKTRDSASLPQDRDPIFTERAYIYLENIPDFVLEMESRNPSEERFSYEDVWWMMMMRLHAWTISVQWLDREGVKIPSEHYENRMRVYIL